MFYFLVQSVENKLTYFYRTQWSADLSGVCRWQEVIVCFQVLKQTGSWQQNTFLILFNSRSVIFSQINNLNHFLSKDTKYEYFPFYITNVWRDFYFVLDVLSPDEDVREKTVSIVICVCGSEWLCRVTVTLFYHLCGSSAVCFHYFTNSVICVCVNHFNVDVQAEDISFVFN